MSAFTHKLGTLNYPRMERQDLTQSQLGSFKFVPTDEVKPFRTAVPSRLGNPYALPFEPNSGIAKQPANVNMTTNCNELMYYGSQSTTLSPTRHNASFFDTVIRPDLAGSRLRLGTTALRAAIDGSPTSKQRRSVDSNGLGSAYHPEVSQGELPAPQGELSDPNSIRSPFPTFVPMATTDMNLLHNSLIRALAAEQQAHQATKQLLASVRQEQTELLAEAQKYQELNRSLLGSVNMLKSLVQHNVRKEQEATQQAQVDQSREEVKAIDLPKTLLHDAVKNLRSDSKGTSYIEHAKKAEPDRAIDANHLFDFDLVEGYGPPALRKHFSSQLAIVQPRAPEEHGPPPKLISRRLNEASQTKPRSDRWTSEEGTANGSSVELHCNQGSDVLNKDPQNKMEYMAMPFDPHVQWTYDPIFDNQQDKFDRLARHDRSNFAEHPVRYLPKKSERNLYRTVMIDFLPNDITYKDILEHLRGGTVEAVQLYGPIGQSTTFTTARVVFTYELGARSVYLRGQTPGIWIRGKRVRVWQVLEPTYPRNLELETEIFDTGFTRFLLVENAAEQSLNQLPVKFASQMQAGFVVQIGQASDGIPMIEFTSIAEASKAFKQLMNDPDFGGSRFDFEEDPCNDPY